MLRAIPKVRKEGKNGVGARNRRLGAEQGFPSRVSRHRSRWPLGGRHQFTCSCHCATDKGIRWSSASSDVQAGAVYIAPASASEPPGTFRYKSDVCLVGLNRRVAESAQRQLVKWMGGG